MLSRRARTLLLACGVCAAIIPAVAQPPEGGLPPGFGEPVVQPPPPPPPPTAPQPTFPDPTLVPPGFDQPPPPPQPRPRVDRTERLPIEETRDSALTDLELLPPPPPPPFYDLPKGEERPVDVVGLINITSRGLALDAFGERSGPFLVTLMERLETPLPSRWAHIMLRRALMSRVAAPRLIDPVDFVAARVRLLVRMGEADAARMLAQAVDVNNYNPNMVRAAYEASLASADPSGLCPIVQKGRDWFNDPVWPMADAMCAALQGEGTQATTLLDQARGRGARGLDLELAQKIVGAGSESRRSVEIQWDDVQEMSPWRFGLASAAGLPIPQRLLPEGETRMRAWMARAPMVPISDRLPAADVAAALGVFSSTSLVDAYSLALDLQEQDPLQSEEQEEAQEDAIAAARQLQTAYSGPDMGARLVALRELWELTGEDAVRRYSRLILTSRAAAAVPAVEEYAGDADEIVASLFAGGLDTEAAEWAGIVEEQGESSLAWALLAVGAPTPVVGMDGDRIEGFAGGERGELRARMLAAALAGLGRVNDSQAAELGVDIGRENVWSRALEQAAAAGQAGTVVLLSAVGMQSGDWDGVPPEHLYKIMRALRQVGLEYEARMMAAEALTRL